MTANEVPTEHNDTPLELSSRNKWCLSISIDEVLTLVERWLGKFDTLRRAERERKCWPRTRKRLFEAGFITYLDAMLASATVFVEVYIRFGERGWCRHVNLT